MSNQVVGTVYQHIIERVISASQNDFEEFGVDSSTLEEMKQEWHEKLSALKVAQFPWDPQPEPPVRQPTVPSNVKNEVDVPVSAPRQEQPVNFPNVPIKTESTYQPPMSSYPPVPANGFSGGFTDNMAQQRAQALVAQRMGQNPPSHMPMHHQQQNQQFYNQGQQRMMQGQPQQRPPQQQMQQRPPPGHVYTSQTDGSDGALEDWNALKAARAAAFAQDPEGHIAADQLMRTQIEAMMAEQDVGLGMSLSQIPKGKKRKAITRVRQAKQAEQAASSSSSVPPVARFDGEDGESPKENPEDAINSDLDDPEDDVDGADGSDDEMVDYMVCTYDKVQRVKNKWKCTLKDGILTSNKKEYLFHKANGEFEW